jgi:hypothetical protein
MNADELGFCSERNCRLPAKRFLGRRWEERAGLYIAILVVLSLVLAW